MIVFLLYLKSRFFKNVNRYLIIFSSFEIFIWISQLFFQKVPVFRKILLYILKIIGQRIYKHRHVRHLVYNNFDCLQYCSKSLLNFQKIQRSLKFFAFLPTLTQLPGTATIHVNFLVKSCWSPRSMFSQSHAENTLKMHAEKAKSGFLTAANSTILEISFFDGNELEIAVSITQRKWRQKLEPTYLWAHKWIKVTWSYFGLKFNDQFQIFFKNPALSLIMVWNHGLNYGFWLVQNSCKHHAKSRVDYWVTHYLFRFANFYLQCCVGRGTYKPNLRCIYCNAGHFLSKVKFFELHSKTCKTSFYFPSATFWKPPA